jgi:outer membrane lipoprotein-sorting protein
MHRSSSKKICAVAAALLLMVARSSFAAPTPADEKDKILRQLDEAAKNFQATQADFEFDSVDTDPIPDKDVQKGTVYYNRKDNAFQMGVHIHEENGHPAPKVYTVSGGVFKLFEPQQNQVTTMNRASKYEGYLQMGFGASGKELEEKWEIKYLGPETLDGVKTEKLELVAKDPDVRKNLSKVTVWIDPERAVSLKQILTFSPTKYKVCVYFNIKVNPKKLPADAFSFNTDKHTTYVNR